MVQCERCGRTFSNPLQRRQHTLSCTQQHTQAQSSQARSHATQQAEPEQKQAEPAAAKSKDADHRMVTANAAHKPGQPARAADHEVRADGRSHGHCLDPRATARECAEAGRLDECVWYYDQAVQAAGAADWEINLEAAKVALELPLLGAAERFANQCVRAAPLSDCAPARAATIHALGMLSRLLRLRGDTEASSARLQQASAKATRWLNPPTASLRQISRTPQRVHACEPVQLAKYPSLWKLPGFVSTQECDRLIHLARPKMESSLMGGSSHTSAHRSSSTAWVSASQDVLLQQLSQRVAAVLGLPVSAISDGQSADSGNIQVVHRYPADCPADTSPGGALHWRRAVWDSSGLQRTAPSIRHGHLTIAQ